MALLWPIFYESRRNVGGKNHQNRPPTAGPLTVGHQRGVLGFSDDDIGRGAGGRIHQADGGPITSSADKADQDGDRGRGKGKRGEIGDGNGSGFEPRPQQVQEGCFSESDKRAVLCKTVINLEFSLLRIEIFSL